MNDLDDFFAFQMTSVNENQCHHKANKNQTNNRNKLTVIIIILSIIGWICFLFDKIF